MAARSRLRRRLRVLRKRLRRALTGPLSQLVARAAPPVYMAYMRLVWATSRVDLPDVDHADLERGTVGLFWHEEVIAAPFLYAKFGLHFHTLINTSAAGSVITRVAERCGHVVFRGGASSRRSRRRPRVFHEMIAHMKAARGVVYGIPVDGSQGPPYRLKRGALVVARECGAPVALARVWFRRCIRLPSWDRVALPLPFNEIRGRVSGLYEVPPDAATREGLERFRRRLEDDLIDLAAESYDAFGQPRPANLVKDDTSLERMAS